MKVLALSGSLREEAFSTRLVDAAADLAPDGVEISRFERLEEIPGFNQDRESEVPEAVEDLRSRIEAADALLVITPEYNASMPGQLKNAIDWASRPHGESALAGKPAAVLSSSPMPFGAIWANQQVRKAFTITGTPTVERELAIGKIDEKIDATNRLTEDVARGDLAALLAELNELVAVIADQSGQEAIPA
ncbi:MAG: NAD(P)H-dependent oxidoreductase [Solirubrobacterales bacterium]|nr:NAD(P)H-dependent oxidoreductase [Solirubrobacterales bacterium]